MRPYAQVLQDHGDNRPLPVPRLPQTAENGTRANIALKAWEQSVARGEPRAEPYLGWKKWYDGQFPLLESGPTKDLRMSTTVNCAGPYSKVAPVPPRRVTRRRDSIIACPISEPGSPVANDFVPVDQIFRKEPYSPSMENEFASPPPRHTQEASSR